MLRRHKFTLLLIALVLVKLICTILLIYDRHHQPRHEYHKSAYWTPTTGRLSVAYRELNEDYFYGSLPVKKTTVVLGDLTAAEELGHIEQRADGTWLITIDTAGHHAERQAEMTLIHEMCHQVVMTGAIRFSGQKDAGLDGHSGAFEACMVSVADRHGFKDLW